MQITVSGKGVDVGESLSGHIATQLEEHVTKYIDRVTSIQVVVSREAHMFRVDITGNLGTHSGLVVRSRGESDDVYAAFDQSLEKTSKQLRRYKRKITNHHHASESGIINMPVKQGKKYTLPADAGEHEEEDKANGVVIAEKPTAIETLTVRQAVMKMDLQDLPALMFFNSAHGGLNVVYRRNDGNISWVDPESKAA